jgi:hypothetical protein
MPRGITATISVTAFRADWVLNLPIAALCERWTISKDQVIRLRDVWELPLRNDRRLRFKPVRQRDPTPREIKAACVRIQATWSQDTEYDRRVTKPQPFILKRIELDDEAREQIENAFEPE